MLVLNTPHPETPLPLLTKQGGRGLAVALHQCEGKERVRLSGSWVSLFFLASVDCCVLPIPLYIHVCACFSESMHLRKNAVVDILPNLFDRTQNLLWSPSQQSFFSWYSISSGGFIVSRPNLKYRDAWMLNRHHSFNRMLFCCFPSQDACFNLTLSIWVLWEIQVCFDNYAMIARKLFQDRKRTTNNSTLSFCSMSTWI